MASKRSGQIIQRGERTWLVRVFLGREAGKRKYANRTVHGIKKDAERVLNELLLQQSQGIAVEPSKQTLSAYLDRWLEDACKSRVRTRTFEDYKALLVRHVRPRIGLRAIAKLSPLDIQGVYSAMLDLGLSPRTVRYVHAVLRSALKQAVRWRLLAANPADSVDLPKKQHKEMQAMTADQVRAFLGGLAGKREHPLFLLAVTTGLRPSEYLALRWVDVAGASLGVRRSLSRFGTFEDTKRAASRRTVQLNGALVVALREHKKRQAEERLAAGPAWDAGDLIFPDHTGRPTHWRTLENRYKAALAIAGLSGFRLYDLRHTAATLALSAGVPVKVISEQLGHADAAMTLNVYSHVLPGMQEDAAARVEALLFGPP